MADFSLIDEMFDVVKLEQQAKKVKEIISSISDKYKELGEQIMAISKVANLDSSTKDILSTQKKIIELAKEAKKTKEELTKAEENL